MDVHCILCDALVETPEIAPPPPPPVSPDVVCVRCRALSGEERRTLREHAMVRMLRAETQARRRE